MQHAAEAWFVPLDQNSVKWHTKEKVNDPENGSSSDAARAVASLLILLSQ
jgi:hypothetical protein